MNEIGTLLGAILLFVCGVIVGGGGDGRQELIEAGVGYYDAKTGDFATRKCATVQVQP